MLFEQDLDEATERLEQAENGRSAKHALLQKCYQEILSCVSTIY